MTSDERVIRERIEAAKAPSEASQSDIEQLRRENADLRAIIEELLHRLYHKKSERTVAPARQPQEKTPGSPSTKAKGDGGHGRAPFSPTLPRETVVADVPEKDRVCSTCHAALVPIGSDVSERGDVRAVRIIVLRHERKKYACPQGHEVKTGDAPPPGLVERAKWTTNTYAFVTVAKYGDHLPLDRIESMLKRQGVHLPKSTMADMAALVAEKMEIVLARCAREILAVDHLQADETPLEVVPEEGRGTKRGYLWVFRARQDPEDPNGAPVEKVLMLFDFSRGQSVPKTFLSGWTGTLQTDGYVGYEDVVEANGIRHAGCWSHARRKWKKAADLGVKQAEPMLQLLRRLWQIEAAVRKRAVAQDLDWTSTEVLLRAVRGRRSRTAVARIRAELDRLMTDQAILPKSPLGKAVGYLNNQWPELQVFLDDPKVEIDTNAIERAIRPVAIGRRNWHVAGSPKGAKTAAALFSIVGMCKALEIDPHTYLADVLEQVSPHADAAKLTPWAWAKAHPEPLPNTS